MAYRLVELVLPRDLGPHVHEYLNDYDTGGVWYQDLSEDLMLAKILVAGESVEGVLDLLERSYGSLEEFRVMLLPVEACLPREEAKETEEKTAPEKEGRRRNGRVSRISREELYHDVLEASRLSLVYTAMIVLSSILAAMGVLRGNIAVIIGAMVIAPLLGPNMALSLGTVLGDVALVRDALKTLTAGAALAAALAILLGWLVHPDPAAPEIAVRTRVGSADVALALSSGAAGALAFTGGASSTLVGVMVAVALLPPLVACGMLLGEGLWDPAWGAWLLFSVNIVCVNLAGVACFWIQGIRPAWRWEAELARGATRKALLLWTVLLALLMLLISVAGKG